jgi:hypothetical protein
VINMSHSYYLRVRRKVSGPISIDKLKELASKGQLSRAHELSPDGKNWEAAGTIPEIFQRRKPELPEKPKEQSKIKETGDDPIAVRPGVEKPTEAELETASLNDIVKDWFYTVDGNQLGPVTAKELSGLIRHGALNRASPVWKPGMSQWVAVGYLPDFVELVAEAPLRNGSGVRDVSPNLSGSGEKSKLVAVLLAILLGGLGIHHFYLGNTLRGIIVLAITFTTLGLGWIVALFEAILIAFSSSERFRSRWCNLEMRFS